MITRRFRLAVPPQLLTVAAVPVLIGSYAALAKDYPDGWIFMVIGLLPFCFISGAQVDTDRKRVRTFVEFLGLKVGRWYAFDAFPELVMLSNQRSFNLASTARSGATFSSGTGRSEGFSTYMMYELYLMDPRHQARIMVGYVGDKEKSEKMANDMSATTGLPWVSYSPGGRFPKKRLDSLSP